MPATTSLQCKHPKLLGEWPSLIKFIENEVKFSQILKEKSAKLTKNLETEVQSIRIKFT